jgi:hypothetical protein
MGIRLEYKKCASVEGSKLLYYYPRGSDLPSYTFTHQWIISSLQQYTWRAKELLRQNHRHFSYSGAAHILTFTHTVRPEMKWGWSILCQPCRPAAPKSYTQDLSEIQNTLKTHAAILPLASSQGESVGSAGTENSGLRIGHEWHRMRGWLAAPTDLRWGVEEKDYSSRAGDSTCLIWHLTSL